MISTLRSSLKRTASSLKRRRAVAAAQRELRCRRRWLPNEVLADALAFLDRPALDRLTLVSRRFARVIEWRFATAPYRLVHSLYVECPVSEHFSEINFGRHESAEATTTGANAIAADGVGSNALPTRFAARLAFLRPQWLRSEYTYIILDGEFLAAEEQAALEQEKEAAHAAANKACLSARLRRQLSQRLQRSPQSVVSFAQLKQLSHLWSSRRLTLSFHYLTDVGQLNFALNELGASFENLCLYNRKRVDIPLNARSLELLAAKCRRLELYADELFLDNAAIVGFLESRAMGRDSDDDAARTPTTTAATAAASVEKWLMVRGSGYSHFRRAHIDEILRLAKEHFIAADSACSYGLVAHCPRGKTRPFEMSNRRTRERLIMYHANAHQVVLLRFRPQQQQQHQPTQAPPPLSSRFHHRRQ